MLAELRSQYRVAQKRLALAQTTYRAGKAPLGRENFRQAGLSGRSTVVERGRDRSGPGFGKAARTGRAPESRYREENLARYEIRAPISGLIIEKAIAQGQTLKEDEEIYTVADVSTVWAAITVYPKDLAAIRVGQKATVRATASDVRGQGHRHYITALLGGQTRTATARVELENKDGRWRPGMFVNAELGSEEIQVPVAVSAEAIQSVRDWAVVFGRYGEYLEARPLELGRSDGNMIEVLKGLSRRRTSTQGATALPSRPSWASQALLSH